MSLKIDTIYAINSFIYALKKLPIFKDLFVGNNIYKSRKAKNIIGFLGVVLSSIRMILSKVIYIGIIYLIASYISKDNTNNIFIHMYFFLTVLGIYINNKLLSTSTKKYFSIVLFNMDAKKYLKSDLVFNTITSFIINFITLYILIGFKYGIVLSIFSLFSRFIGEALSIKYYKKYNYLAIFNMKIYWPILIGLLLVTFLPYINIIISFKYVLLVTLLFIPCSIISYIYINSIKDYKLIYKKLNTINKVMISQDEGSYNRQSMVEVRDKDKYINSKKLKNKKGYDLFNTIFFERHREILLKSAKNYSMISIGIILVLVYLVINNKGMSHDINYIILNKLSYFVLLMYFINRGSIITQAMFYNCDHAMLTFNFYKDPKVIVNLFKKRLEILTKINLMPAFVLAIGSVLLLYLSGGTSSFINYISIPVFVISLSVFFSTHYLVLYYLLQPYDKNMKIKSFSYSIASFFTYLFSYYITKLVVSSLVFSMAGVMLSILYISISLWLVYRFAPGTFRLK
ncbi:MAG: hypothetical protein E7160_04415 [Firmicutes bacterium]|nr:hypothetical protein [Bacillota bacterium]